jgi:hypothetical protein
MRQVSSTSAGKDTIVREWRKEEWSRWSMQRCWRLGARLASRSWMLTSALQYAASWVLKALIRRLVLRSYICECLIFRTSLGKRPT